MIATAASATSRDSQTGARPVTSSLWADANGVARAVRLLGIDPAPASPRARLRSAMLKDRKTVLMDGLGWDLKSPDGLHEIDQFDREDTLYLVVHQAETGRHLGSVRLLPSTQPHLLGDVFAHLCADGVPIGPDVYEITRLVTAPGLSRGEALQVRQQLSIALLEHALASGITRYTMVTHLPWLPSLLAIGWDAEPLGMPHGEGADAIAALQILVDTASLDRLRREWAMPGTMFSDHFQIGGEGTLAN